MRDVLHIPGSVCNGFNSMAAPFGSLGFRDGSTRGWDSERKILFYTEPRVPDSNRLPSLVLAESYPKGINMKDDDDTMILSYSLFLSEIEEQRLFPPRKHFHFA